MRRLMLVLSLIGIAFSLLIISLRIGLGVLFPSSVVAYVARQDGNPTLFIHDLTHDLKRHLFDTDFIQPAWSSDGRFLAITQLLRYGSDIIVSDLTGTMVQNLTQSQARNESPAWSPDGEWIAYSSNRDGDTNIYVMHPDGSDNHAVTDNQAGDLNPTWSPDNQMIAFSSNRNGSWDIFSLNLESGKLAQLTTHSAPDTMPAWSPDGQQIAFVSRRDGSSSIYVLSLETGYITPAVIESTHDDMPQWTPDSRAITFSRSVNTLSMILRYDIASRAMIKVDLGEVNVDSLVWMRS